MEGYNVKKIDGISVVELPNQFSIAIFDKSEKPISKPDEIMEQLLLSISEKIIDRYYMLLLKKGSSKGTDILSSKKIDAL